MHGGLRAFLQLLEFRISNTPHAPGGDVHGGARERERERERERPGGDVHGGSLVPVTGPQVPPAPHQRRECPVGQIMVKHRLVMFQ